MNSNAFSLSFLIVAFIALSSTSSFSQKLANNNIGTLEMNEELRNENGYTLIMQSDGNLVLHRDGSGVKWASHTTNSGAVKAVMQPDGNLVLYKSDGTPIWSTGTHGNLRAKLSLQSDGNLVIYSSNGKPIWDSQSSK